MRSMVEGASASPTRSAWKEKEKADKSARVLPPRDIGAADLCGQHTEKMKAIDVVGINGADLPVEALGLDQPAGLVVRERHGEPLGYLHRRSGGTHRRGTTWGRLALAFRSSPLFSVHGKEPDCFAERPMSARLFVVMRWLVAPQSTKGQRKS